MPTTSTHYDLQLVSPNFDSKLTDALIELNHLRKMELGGSTPPWLFFQLKRIFHLLESVGSARIEGNKTTISEYVEKKIENTERSTERYSEIANVENAMSFIDEAIASGVDITHHFIRQLHQLTVADLNHEGDKTPGAYRTWDVEIANSSHRPTEAHNVQSYMDELITFINHDDGSKYDLIKIATAHHRFVWIHPFGNGNGRVVRLLTYALLIKYGFRIKNGQIINPTAVFCSNREKYYDHLSIADKGDSKSILIWCEYVLTGLSQEMSKVNNLLNYTYLLNEILLPTITMAAKRKLISNQEEKVLKVSVKKQSFKSADVKESLPGSTPRQVTHLISKLKSKNMIDSVKENGREYCITFNNNYLMRCLIECLENKSLIPKINT